MKMVETYRCPKCDGTEIAWDRAARKAVCPKDKTLVSDYKIVQDMERRAR